MALDRDSIVRTDFPTNRRGFDPDAVEAHLTALAGEVEALQRRAAQPTTLSAQAGEQVRAIVQAAERGAEEIRAKAGAEAAERVARVTDAAERLRARVERMDSDLARVMSELRDQARRLCDDLEGLRADATRLGAATAEPADAEPATAEAPTAAAAQAPREAGPNGAASPQAAAPRKPAAPREEAAPSPPGAAAPPADAARPTAAAPPPNGDLAAARIVALDMALSGKSREETERFIAEHYDVSDRAALLDEVYAAAGG